MLISVKQIAKQYLEFLTKYILTSLTVLNIIWCISNAFMHRGLKLDLLAYVGDMNIYDIAKLYVQAYSLFLKVETSIYQL